MKFLTTFVAIALLTLTASAAPILLIKTTITQHNRDGTNKLLSSPSIVVESGKRAIIQVGGLEYAISAKLNDDGTVHFYAALAEQNKDKVTKFVGPPIMTKLGEMAEIEVGEITITTKISVAPNGK